MISLADAQERLRNLLRERSYKEQRVTLASGRESDWFIDVKQTALSAEGHALVGRLMLDAVCRVAPEATAVCGVALGGCSLASSVAHASFLDDSVPSIDAVYVRKQVKDHGSARNLEGNDRIARGSKVVVLEDVVTTGGSTIAAVQSIRERYVVETVVALVDREEGGAVNLSSEGLSLHAFFTRSDLLSGRAL